MLSGATEQSEELGYTIDRIAARLGETQVHGVKAVAEHRPEDSWATAASAGQASAPGFSGPAVVAAARAQALRS